MKGCSLGAGIDAQVRSIFGPYAVAFHGSGHTARVFLPNGAPLTEKMGMVWCRFNRTADLASEYLLIRHQVYATTSAAEEGFSLALNMQDKATPDNAYSVTKRGKLTLAVRKYGEVMALRGEQIAVAAWNVPRQQPDQINRNVSGSQLVRIMGALLCEHSQPSC